MQTAVFAGGCFWGVEAVFEHVKGVKEASSGYAGGTAATADYGTVSSGGSGHAESVKVVFDPSVISYGQLLKVFFSVAHDPTQLNRQGPDRGSQYRSAIFTTSPEQQRIATAYIAQMSAARSFGNKPIVTQVGPLKAFYPAEKLPPGFRPAQSDASVHHLLGCTQGGRPEEGISGLVPGQLAAGGPPQPMQKTLSLLPSGSRK